MSRSLRAITPVAIISRGLLVGGLLYSPLLLAQEGDHPVQYRTNRNGPRLQR